MITFPRCRYVYFSFEAPYKVEVSSFLRIRRWIAADDSTEYTSMGPGTDFLPKVSLEANWDLAQGKP